MRWSFPVTADVPLSVNVYFANRCDCTALAGQRIFDMSIDGNQVINDLDLCRAGRPQRRDEAVVQHHQ